MNRSTKLRSCFTLVTLFATILVLTGCMSKRTEIRAPELRGRVLDADTHLPISGVKVFFSDPPEEAVYTGADGRFLMKESKVTYSMSYGGHVYPIRKHSDICLSHTNYITLNFLRWDIGDPMNILMKSKP